MPKIVPISEVSIRPQEPPVSRHAVKRIKKILDEQGLIEPLIVNSAMQVGRRVWDAERLVAAQELGWTTVLVTDGRY